MSIQSFLKFFFLLAFSINVIHSQVTVAPHITRLNGTLPSADPNNDTDSNFTIIPGTTQRVDITLTGVSQTIIFTFLSDPSRTDAFKLTVTDNGKANTPTMTYFSAPETLDLSLDSRRLLVVLQGNQRFRISKYVREPRYSYEIYVREQVVVPIKEDNAQIVIEYPDSGNGDGFNKNLIYYIVFGIVGGCMGIVISIKLFFHIKKNWYNNRLAHWIRQRKVKLPDSGQKPGILLVGGNAILFSKPSMDVNSIDLKSFSTLNDKMDYDTEIGLRSAKKKSMASVAPSTLANLEANTKNSTGSTSMSKITGSSAGSLQNITNGYSLGSGSRTSLSGSASASSSNSISDGSSASSQSSLQDGPRGIFKYLNIPFELQGRKRFSTASAGCEIKPRFYLQSNLQPIREESSPSMRKAKMSVDLRRLPPIEWNNNPQGKRKTWFGKNLQIMPLTTEKQFIEKPNERSFTKSELDSPAGQVLFPSSPLLTPHTPLSPITESPDKSNSPAGKMLLQYAQRKDKEKEEMERLMEARRKAKTKNKHKILDPEEMLRLVALAQKELEGIKEEDTDSENESEEDPNDEILQLPNFFCCMICLKGQRNMVSRPCGHIFSCKGCSKKVMASNKECIMCSKKIRSVTTLKAQPAP